jgi:thioredoxin 1
VVEQVAAEMAGKANVYELDVDKAPNTPSEFGVMSLPTMLFFKGGKVVDRIVGGAKKDKIIDKLKALS